MGDFWLCGFSQWAAVRGNPSFVWRSAAVLVLGFNRGQVRVLCFFFLAKNPKSQF